MKYKLIEQVRPNDAGVDHSYQRPVDEAQVKLIVKTYNPALIGVPVVSRRPDGSLYMIDAQHRWAALRQLGLGDKPIQMEVHYGLSLEEEAAMFLHLNESRRSVSAYAKHKARLVAQHAEAIAIRSMLDELGCRIVNGPQKFGVAAVAAVYRAYSKGSLRATIQSLKLWLDGDHAAFDRVFIDAVSEFFAVYPQASAEELGKRLSSFDSAKLKTKLRREAQSIGEPITVAAQLVLVEIYNKNRPMSHRLERRTT